MRRKPIRTRRELKLLAVKYKGGRCEECGYHKCLASLTFHHQNPAKKSFPISSYLTKITWNILKLELDKCRLLCANCHNEEHYEIVS